MEDKKIRLNKYISEAGVASRREADRLIEAGQVTVNGEIAVCGMQVGADDTVCVKGEPITSRKTQVLVKYYKPEGVVCTAEKMEKDNIYKHFDYPRRLLYIGRLDKSSEGLLLFTDDGDLANEISKAANYHEKEYIVEVNRPISKAFLQKLSNGVEIEIDGRLYQTRPCKVKSLGVKRFSIVLTQGFNRQIRRMCRTLGYRVVKLRRIRVMNLTLDGLEKGKWAEVTGQEREELFKLLKL